MKNKTLAHYSLRKKKNRPISGNLKCMTVFFLMGILTLNTPANAQLKSTVQQPIVKSQAENTKKKRITGKVTDEKG